VDGFVPDSKIQQVAEAHAVYAVDVARDQCGVTLDWSDESMRSVESILQRFHEEFSKARPPNERIRYLVIMFGSYVGEVFRRNHGAR
jgi:hypothetical protein